MFRWLGRGGASRADQRAIGELDDAAFDQWRAPPQQQVKAPEAVGYERLRDLLRQRQPMAPEAAARFGLSANSVRGGPADGAPPCKTYILGGQSMWQSWPTVLLPLWPQVLPKEARRALVVGVTVESIEERTTGDAANRTSAKRRTLFAERPSRPEEKVLKEWVGNRYPSDHPAALRAKESVVMQSVSDDRASAESPPTVGVLDSSVLPDIPVLLDDKAMSKFGTDAVAAQEPGAVAVGFNTDFHRRLGIQRMHVGVTTQVAEFPPSYPEYPDGFTTVSKWEFTQIPARRGVKVKLFTFPRPSRPTRSGEAR